MTFHDPAILIPPRVESNLGLRRGAMRGVPSEKRMAAPVVHFEIGIKDTAKARAFYGPLFGWEFSDYGPASMIANIGGMCGGQGIGGHLNNLGHPPHNYCVIYALVDNLEATIAQATKLGGKSVVPPTEVPGMGHFAWITDPEGNCVGLWKAAPQQQG
ncbi:MAG: hypothetical protein AMXMBFR47_18930 [Planctomycetota bacterium]